MGMAGHPVYKCGTIFLMSSITLSQRVIMAKNEQIILTDLFGSDDWAIDEMVWGLI